MVAPLVGQIAPRELPCFSSNAAWHAYRGYFEVLWKEDVLLEQVEWLNSNPAGFKLNVPLARCFSGAIFLLVRRAGGESRRAKLAPPLLTHPPTRPPLPDSPQPTHPPTHPPTILQAPPDSP